MLTKRIALIGTTLALATAAFAAPAHAASSDGADVNRTDYCVDGEYYRACHEGITVGNQIQTPGGIQSFSSSGKSLDTSSSSWDGYYEEEYTTRTHFHELQKDGQLVELGDHRMQQTTQISPESSGPCIDLEDFHTTNDSVQYLRETAYCR
ncbi:hypothetical protein [Arthrobacter sp. B1I2]|uniref:hypothetical protein n=1 Tax=Arthrobacter sp. B1I2 TaxID=3042263 RepID=UPI00278624AC|nr:hypothetical protein [Arthrobacter sp. B1I2]MDQ0729256.1 hypothetical protein [Arthrobacter sp. B1I2]